MVTKSEKDFWLIASPFTKQFEAKLVRGINNAYRAYRERFLFAEVVRKREKTPSRKRLRLS